jgi:hypothetical protein
VKRDRWRQRRAGAVFPGPSFMFLFTYSCREDVFSEARFPVYGVTTFGASGPKGLCSLSR